MKSIICSLVVLLCSMAVNGQNKYMADETKTRELSKEVVALFYENDIKEAFDKIQQYWPMPQNEIDEIRSQTIRYMNMLRERFGKPIGTVRSKEERISDIAIRETYLVRYEYSAIRVIFTFYKNDQGWIINAFKWDDSFTEEFR
jgi:hypothetical protein